MAGLHKLIDIGTLQTGSRKAIFDRIIKNKISMQDIIISKYFDDSISKRIQLLSHMEEILDSNQIVFKYMAKNNKLSRIDAEYLIENTHKLEIVYIFLNERNKRVDNGCPVMCCRSFFPMNKLDYAKNQPSYTLLKKEKSNIVTGKRILQYDREILLEKAKSSPTETDRKSIMMQLNEKKAQIAINDVLEKKKQMTAETSKNEYERH
ncbi:MAG: PBECR4 domain-containing protein [Ruminococcus flavefaciens]|nr:PBECR4 domain-containing protein [Ruminococcus flavefaciens]